MNALTVADPPVLSDELSLVRRFLSWMPQASVRQRADAVSALARAYLHCELSPDARGQAEIALTAVLDDADARVRRALAEAFASACNAPRHIVLALANDHSEVSRAPLALSPLLSDADLVDCAATGDAVAQTAIARRSHLSAPIAAAIAEVGERAAALALVDNREAEIGRPALWRLFERFRDDAELRGRLVDRPGLPSSLRAAIAVATTADIASFAAASAWLDPRRADRIARDGREQAFVAIAADSGEAELAELMQWLRAEQHLTVGLLVRALTSGDTRLFRQSLTEMSGLPPRRVAGLLRDPRGHGFGALYNKARMPQHLLAAFRIAAGLAAQAAGPTQGVDYTLTMKMLRAIEARSDSALAPIVAMLWRLAGEGARDDAREFAALASAPAEVVEPELAALELEASAPHVLLLNVEPGNENYAPPITVDLTLSEAAAA